MLKRGDFKSPDELKKAFPSLDRMKYKERWWVIDVRGGNIRIMLKIDFPTQTVYVKHITNHTDYDKLIAGFRSEK
ncbi:type II toxin-antitoxin system HigB family toxin [Rosenbergiella collisarenosi]|uniref:type II toxin-antitoxin system HigB family toxin n=1 Tax=Rosenbergiella collisarenosi TaxID=1544695 RepID=UPI0031450A04